MHTAIKKRIITMWSSFHLHNTLSVLIIALISNLLFTITNHCTWKSCVEQGLSLVQPHVINLSTFTGAKATVGANNTGTSVFITWFLHQPYSHASTVYVSKYQPINVLCFHKMLLL